MVMIQLLFKKHFRVRFAQFDENRRAISSVEWRVSSGVQMASGSV
jgi:hypothetical protein